MAAGGKFLSRLSPPSASWQNHSQWPWVPVGRGQGVLIAHRLLQGAGPWGEGGSRQLGKPLANWAGSFPLKGVALGPLKCAGRMPAPPPAPLPGILEVTFLGYVFSILCTT